VPALLQPAATHDSLLKLSTAQAMAALPCLKQQQQQQQQTVSKNNVDTFKAYNCFCIQPIDRPP
jgi:hypothetical protein